MPEKVIEFPNIKPMFTFKPTGHIPPLCPWCNGILSYNADGKGFCRSTGCVARAEKYQRHLIGEREKP